MPDLAVDGPPGAEPIDPQLQPLLRPSPAGSHQSLLATLLQDEARPIIRSVVRRELRNARWADASAEDAEDVESGVIAQVLTRLTDLTAGVDADPIRDFRAYVAVAAFHGCHAFIRQRHPERARLKNRLRYLLSHDRRFATWEGQGARRLSGLRAWHGREESQDAARRLRDLTAEPGDLTGQCRAAPVEETAAVLAILTRIDGPAEIDDLTRAVAAILQIRDAPAVVTEAGPPLVDRLADPRASVETELEGRASLQQLWDEVCLLPLRQRLAILLNLRDPEGGGALALLPSTGVASIRAIAAVLEIPAVEFAGIWGTLPLDDAAIAARLGVTRQQVINLRKAARDRLGRRMRAGNIAPR